MAKKEANKKTGGKASVQDYGLLLRPLITEKATVLSSGGKTLAFEVPMPAGKAEIKSAVERVFGVEVAKVRTCRFIGKLKRTTRNMGRTSSYKKAYVTLKPGHTIDIVEGL